MYTKVITPALSWFHKQFQPHRVHRRSNPPSPPPTKQTASPSPTKHRQVDSHTGFPPPPSPSHREKDFIAKLEATTKYVQQEERRGGEGSIEDFKRLQAERRRQRSWRIEERVE